MTFMLASPVFEAGQRIPREHGCEGADTPPPLAWTGAPAGTRSYALIVSDPDAPGRTWYHWALYDIPAETSELKPVLPAGTRAARNDFGRTGYGGPCPPPGHGVHRYQFRLLALDTERIDLPATAGARDLERAALKHKLAETTLTGTYSR